MSGEAVNGLYALAICLGAGSLCLIIGLLVVRVLCDKDGYVRRWK